MTFLTKIIHYLQITVYSLPQANQNIVSTSTMLPASVQIVGMRPGAPTQNQQKNAVSGLSPRVVIGGPMVGARPQSPAVSTILLIRNHWLISHFPNFQITLNALQPGQAGSALLLKTETGYQLLRVGPPSATPVAQNIPNSGNQTIRLQTVPAVSRFTGPPLALRKTIVTQHQVKQKQNVISQPNSHVTLRIFDLDKMTFPFDVGGIYLMFPFFEFS